MSTKPLRKQTEEMAAMLSPELGYRWDPPAPPTPPQAPHIWSVGMLDPVSHMTEEMLRIDWRLPHLRELITALGLEPEGHTRRQAARQLAERFLDPERLARSVQSLSDEELKYYTLLNLQSRFYGHYPAPEDKKLWQGFSTSWPKLAERIARVGLALATENEELYLPGSLRRRLPQLQIPFPSCTEPRKIISADPREILTQLQQLLGLLQTESFKLSDQLRWLAPEYPYAQPVVCWPPAPADAQKLSANLDMEGSIELFPPAPGLDATTLDTWTRALGCSEDRAESLYALLVTGGIILRGSPITVDSALAQQWLALTPGRQVGMLYRLWRDVTTWSDWWPLWREGRIHVTRLYHGYWGLASIDGAVATSVIDLRGVLLELLSFLPHNTWLAMSELTKWLATLFPTPDTHRYPMGFAFEGPKGGWQDFLETVLLSMITGPLYALGLVDVGPSADNVKAIRLHGLQDLHWERRMEVDLEAVGRLRREALRFIESEYIVEIEPPVPPDFVTFVLRWATPAGFSRNVVRYRLDTQRLHATFERGMDPNALSALWAAAAGHEPLPEIAQWWETWWQHYGHVRIYPAQALLQTRDAVTMRELQVAFPRLQSALLGALSPNAVLLNEESVESFVSDLTRQGYMPKET